MTIERFNNLHEVWQYSQQLMKLAVNQIDGLSRECLVNLYEQANNHVR